SRNLLTQFLEVAAAKKQQDYPVHIKFYTGLDRLGFSQKDTYWIAEQVANNDTIKVKSLFSHLAASEDPNERVFSLGQIESF
ncbi:alanine racemase, partial [Winogradskyella poriferorum]|uniref:alanine racemase n=1 Tax=Winogradskyella poriferorum TaxID=307627 RepID=UPI003D64AD87